MGKILKEQENFDLFKNQTKVFDKKIKEIANTVGRFMAALAKPKVLELFTTRGIKIVEIHRNVEISLPGQQSVEIDLLLQSSIYSIAVEVKTLLTKKSVNEHLSRLEEITNNLTKKPKKSLLHKKF